MILYFLSLFFKFFKYIIQHCFICRPSGSTVSEDAGIEPRDCCYFGIDSQKLLKLGNVDITHPSYLSKCRVAKAV